MQYSVLGPTGVKVSRICLGTATFGVAPSVQDADRIVGTALPTCLRRCARSGVDLAVSSGNLRHTAAG